MLETLEDVFQDPTYRNLHEGKTIEELCNSLIQTDVKSDTSRSDCFGILEVLKRIFRPGMSSEEMLETSRYVFGTGSMTSMEGRYTNLLNLVQGIEALITKHPLYDLSKPLKLATSVTLERIGYALNGAFKGVVGFEIAKSESSASCMSKLRQSNLSGIDRTSAMSDLTASQRVVREFLDICASDYLRKDPNISEDDKDPMLYRPVFKEDNQTYLHYYEPYMTMRKYIYTKLKMDPALWAATTRTAKTIPDVIREMKFTEENKLPSLKMNRFHWSYNNGVYDIRNCKFYYYHPEEPGDWSADDLDFGEVSVYYLDQEFEYKKYRREMLTGKFDKDGNPRYDPRRIKTPSVEKIMDSQKWSPGVRWWFYAMFFGRQLFPLKTKDKWEVYALLQGQGGTGKSTFLKLFMMFYPIEKTGILNSEGRSGFPVQHLYDKLFIACMECGGLDMAVDRFCSMIAAERMGIERLFKVDIAIDWSTPIAMAGNTAPKMPNEGDAVGRRTLAFRFKYVVKNMDPTLMDSLISELPAIMYKGTKLYDAIYKKHGKNGIWDGFSGNKKPVLPLEFHDNRRYIQSLANPIYGFLTSSAVERDPDAHCSWNDFREKFETYCDNWNIKKRPTMDQYDTCFEINNITRKDPRGKDADQHHGYTEPYLEGCKIVDGASITPSADRERVIQSEKKKKKKRKNREASGEPRRKKQRSE